MVNVLLLFWYKNGQSLMSAACFLNHFFSQKQALTIFEKKIIQKNLT